jgi:hypothetical protein
LRQCCQLLHRCCRQQVAAHAALQLKQCIIFKRYLPQDIALVHVAHKLDAG